MLPTVVAIQTVVAPREASSATAPAPASASAPSPSLQPGAATTTPTTTAIRAGGIAPGGSLAARPGSAGSKPPQQLGVRSPILPVQRAPVRESWLTRWLVHANPCAHHCSLFWQEQRAHRVERLAKITSAGPVYRGTPELRGSRQASPVLGPRATTMLLPPPIVTQEKPAAKVCQAGHIYIWQRFLVV